MRLAAAIVTLLALAALTATASGQAPGPPINDHYLNSLRLNEPGSRLERTDTLRDLRATGTATTQGDVFSPPQSGGPREVTQCGSTNYGRTLWYDFYPDVPGLARIRANGLDAVITVLPFSLKTAQPDFAHRVCINQSSSTSEELFAPVKKHGSYSIQLGGVNGAGGNMEMLFDFLADTDGDGVLDDVDKCRRFKGARKRAGCPAELSAKPTFAVRPTGNGVQVVSLKVKASRRSRVSVSCTRHACRTRSKKAGKRALRFRQLAGDLLPAGSKVIVRVTRKGAIGQYVAFPIKAGNLGDKIERCLNPGSRKPRRKCG